VVLDGRQIRRRDGDGAPSGRQPGEQRRVASAGEALVVRTGQRVSLQVILDGRQNRRRVMTTRRPDGNPASNGALHQPWPS
jgi:hypothetical protein